ncbi:MAG TPA: hypothetical protein VG479_02265 [Gaiellaceae bacterium]|jgi:hypothetical protein|nr:hypothetical protein [Gaiellaceae bacterium]
MAKGKLAAVAVAVGSALGAAAIWRRRSGQGSERVEVYYADGSMVTFPEGSDEAARLLPVARRVLWQARS